MPAVATTVTHSRKKTTIDHIKCAARLVDTLISPKQNQLVVTPLNSELLRDALSAHVDIEFDTACEHYYGDDSKARALAGRIHSQRALSILLKVVNGGIIELDPLDLLVVKAALSDWGDIDPCEWSDEITDFVEQPFVVPVATGVSDGYYLTLTELCRGLCDFDSSYQLHYNLAIAKLCCH